MSITPKPTSYVHITIKKGKVIDFGHTGVKIYVKVEDGEIMATQEEFQTACNNANIKLFPRIEEEEPIENITVEKI